MRLIREYGLRTRLLLLLGSVSILIAWPCLAQLAIPLTVEGRVTDRAGRSLSGVTIAAGGHEVITNDQGGFRIELTAAPGSLEVRAYLKDHPEIERTERIEVSATDAPGTRRVTLVLPLGSRSRVEDQARPGDDRPSAAAAPGARGEDFDVRALPPPPPPPPPPAPEPPPPAPSHASPPLPSVEMQSGSPAPPLPALIAAGAASSPRSLGQSGRHG